MAALSPEEKKKSQSGFSVEDIQKLFHEISTAFYGQASPMSDSAASPAQALEQSNFYSGLQANQTAGPTSTAAPENVATAAKVAAMSGGG